jgi:hypothetical protein
VEKQTCPVGFRCSRDAVEPERCANKISDPATGKCVSCDDKHFANTATNECMRCPQNADGGKILTGVECKSGRIDIEKDFFVEGSGASVAVPLSATLCVLKCRGTGVCNSTVNKTDFTVQTKCIPPAAGALCGACEDGYAKGTPGTPCVACASEGGTVPALILLGALLVFAFLYRQTIKHALENARAGKNKHITFSLLKIGMAFLFQTSLLSRFGLDWGGLMEFIFQVSSVAGSGDVTQIASVQCYGLDLHAKTKLMAAAPFIVLLLPLPLLLKAHLKHHATVFGVPQWHAYRAVVLGGWWLLHPVLLAHCVVTLLTVPVSGKEYALADLSIETSDPAYVKTCKLAVALLCTFVLALPLYIFGALYRWREDLRAGEHDDIPEGPRVRLFYFYGSFSPRRYYWEGVVFAVRTMMALLTALSATLVERDFTQMVVFATTWVTLLNFVAAFKFKPYAQNIENKVNNETQGALLALLLCALGLSLDVQNTTFATVLDNFCAALLLGTIGFLVFALIKESRWRCFIGNGKGNRRLSQPPDVASEGHDVDVAPAAKKRRSMQENPMHVRPMASARQTQRDKAQAKQEHEHAFNNSLEPLLRKWMGEAPTMTAAALLADKAKVLKLEQTLATPVCRAELATLVPAIAARIRATAEPYTGEGQIKRLLAIVAAGNKLYFGIYHGVLDMVRSNDDYGEFSALLNSVTPDRSRFPQRTADLAAIYSAAALALPLFGKVLEDTVQRAGAAVETRVAPLKHVFRVLQKHATRVDGGAPTEFETACDIVRGSIVCECMSDLLDVLQLLLAMENEGRVKIVRIKNRFQTPTAAGWADARVNFVCFGGGAAAAGHVCELQLVHTTMLKARKEFGGHQAYAAFREAAELLDFVVGGVLTGSAEAAVAALEAAQAGARGGGSSNAWAAARDSAGAALEPVRRARALVPDGGDAAVAADTLLRRAKLADMFVFNETGGGEAGGAVVADLGRSVSRRTRGGYGRVHACTASVESGCFRVQIEGNTNRLGLGLADAQKALSKDKIIRDDDVWMMYCDDGWLWSGGKSRPGAGKGALRPGDVLDLEYDADARTLRFLLRGKELGRHTGVARAAKLVVTMGSKGNALRLLDGSRGMDRAAARYPGAAVAVELGQATCEDKL